MQRRVPRETAERYFWCDLAGLSTSVANAEHFSRWRGLRSVLHNLLESKIHDNLCVLSVI